MDFGKLAATLKVDEGLRLMPYADAGGISIGYGHSLTFRGITPDQALWLLHDDIVSTVNALNVALPWFSDLDDVRQRVIANAAFNMGVSALLGFHKMLAAMAAQDYVTAALELLDSDAARTNPQRYQRLAQQLRTGVE